MSHVAITNHGSISGAIALLKEAKKAKIQPIIGLEAYVCEQDSKIKDDSNRDLSHLVLLARNDRGYKELVKLVSASNHPDSYYYKPRLSLEEIAQYNCDDFICVNGHMGSPIGNICLEDKEGWDAINTVAKYRGIFKHFYLECQLVDPALSDMVNLTKQVRELARKTNTPILATNDAHYCTQDKVDLHRILLCRNLGSVTLAEARAKGAFSAFFNSDKFYLKSYEEMIASGHTEAELDCTNEVASLCEPYTDILKDPILPHFPCPEGYDADEWLRQLCRNGWVEKIKEVVPLEQQQVYTDRVKEELDVLQGADLSSYFLIVEDIISEIKRQGGLPGPGRGSAAGCLVSYLIGITQIDPIKYNLIFQRFFNAGRGAGTMPDIDIDVPVTMRDNIIQYIRKRYGEDNVAQMITYTTAKGRGALKDVLRAYGMPFDTMNKITKYLPEEAKIADELQQMKQDYGESSIIKWALEHDDSGKLKEWCYLEDDELQGPYAKRFQQAIDYEDTKLSRSKHAAGVVITESPIAEMCPMVYDTKNKTTIAGFELNDLESVGCIKFDLLGLNFLDKVMGIKDILETGDINEL
jgi:DNA polymerase-3 subunit alpha